MRDHARDEKKRAEKLTEARARHEEQNQQEAHRVDEWNGRLEERRSAYRERDVDAVEWFIDQALAASKYPHGFPEAQLIWPERRHGSVLFLEEPSTGHSHCPDID